MTYDAAKAGVMRFTESLAQEWAPYGVRVNSIAPGSFPDSVQMSAEDYQARQEVALEQVPLGRVNYLAVFLALPPPAYVTGKTWAVDGGMIIKTG